MIISSYIDFLKENYSNNRILYKAMDTYEFYMPSNNDSYIFASTSKTFAENFEEDKKYLFEIEVEMHKTFYSEREKDIQLLYDNAIKLGSNNSDSESRRGNSIDGYFYDEEILRGYYLTPKDYLKSDEVRFGNTWQCIEETPGVIEWIRKQKYDSISITEDNYTNYILFRETIKKYKLLK